MVNKNYVIINISNNIIIGKKTDPNIYDDTPFNYIIIYTVCQSLNRITAIPI